MMARRFRMITVVFVALLAFSTNVQSKQRSVRSATPEILLASLTAFFDSLGGHVGYSDWFAKPIGTVVRFYYEKAGSDDTEIPPPIVVTKENFGWSNAGWIFGGRFWGEPVPKDATAFKAVYSGALNFTVIHYIAGTGPIKDAFVRDGRIYIKVHDGFSYPTPLVASVLGRGVSVDWGWITPPDGPHFYGLVITPPEGSDYHGAGIPVTVCGMRVFGKSECGTALQDIPLSSN